MTIRKFKSATILCLFLFSSLAHAELMFNTAKLYPSGGFSGYLVISDVNYEGESGGDFDIERKIIGGDYTIPIDRDMNFTLQAGLIFDAESDGSSNDGQGFQFGGGGRMKLHATRTMRLLGFGLVNYTTENYDGPGDPSLSLIDIHLGVTARFIISRTISPYAGLELALYSDGDIESGSAKADIERDDLILINLGVIVPMDAAELFFEITIGGEQTLTFGATFI